MNASGARLIVRQGTLPEQEFELSEETIVLGREVINDIIVSDPEVSRKHAQISFQAGRHIIEDLGSTNGTMVNGRRISVPTPLNEGDLIDLGESTRLTYHGSSGSADRTVVQAVAGDSYDKTVAEPIEPILEQQVVPTKDQPPLIEAIPAPSYQRTADPAVAENDAERYVAQESLPPPPQETRNWNRVFIGCGCLLFLIVVACAAALFLLDAFAPDTLYCGPGQAIFELLGFDLACS